MRTSHVVALDSTHPDSPPGCMAFRCENCGVKVSIHLPISTSEFVAIAEDFTKRHRNCSVVETQDAPGAPL